MEPLTGVLKFSCEEVAAASIVDAAVAGIVTALLIAIYLYTGEIVVEGDIISFICSLAIA